jgi:hypothetical protein
MVAERPLYAGCWPEHVPDRRQVRIDGGQMGGPPIRPLCVEHAPGSTQRRLNQDVSVEARRMLTSLHAEGTK